MCFLNLVELDNYMCSGVQAGHFNHFHLSVGDFKSHNTTGLVAQF
jgi:hypothetical protein